MLRLTLPVSRNGLVSHEDAKTRSDADGSAIGYAIRPARSTSKRFAVALLVLCAACAEVEDAADPAADDTTAAVVPGDTMVADARTDAEADRDAITPDGWRALRIGMTRAEVVAAMGEDANPAAVGGPDPERCDQFRPQRAPEGLLVMVQRDTLTRISLSDGTGIRTADGFGIGDEAAAIEAAYGTRAEIEPHEYGEAPARYITVWSGAAAEPRGIRFEIGSDGRVQHIHAGSRSIGYVEGCL